jgi:UDP-N-acetylglucosamine 1-carboxyvinyltransferase
VCYNGRRDIATPRGRVSWVAKIIVTGGQPLEGKVRASGSKNGTLPLLAAALLVPGETILENVPRIEDVRTMLEMLQALGARWEWLGPGELRIDARGVNRTVAPYDLVRRMRGSFYVAGALLARFREAEVPLPGGCVIGPRPVDFHLAGFRALGAQIEEQHGVMRARAAQLRGGRINLDPRFRSVGATINIMLAACLAEGTTVIENASREPEVVSCQEFLSRCGARIQGIGASTVVIEGVTQLHPTRYRAIPDRMEAGTFLLAGALTGGDVTVEDVRPDHMHAPLEKLEEAGFVVHNYGDALRVRGGPRPRAIDITTAPYPGFPTDLQPNFGVLAAVAEGTSVIEETIFEARFNYADELARMGADIRVVGRAAIIRGVDKLFGAPVEATDIRAASALLLAGLIAEGKTEIDGAQFLDRGYEDAVGKLRALGAHIERLEQGAQETAVCSR